MSNEGKRVQVHYTGTLDDGTKFDSSLDRGKPLEFVCMAGQMIPGFDMAVKDMAVGDKVKVHIEAKDAYGEHDPMAVQTVALSQVQGIENYPIGEMVMLKTTDLQQIPARLMEIGSDTATFDLNHELAGKDLNFEIELLEVRDA